MPKPATREYREYVGKNTRIVQRLLVDGFVVKPEHLRQLHALVTDCEVFKNSSQNSPVKYRALLENGNVVQFRDLDEILNYPNTSPEVIEGLRISRLGAGEQKVEIELDSSGSVRIDACGSPHIVEAVVHTISQYLRAVDQQFSWFARIFVLDRRPRRLATMLAAWASLTLVFLIGYYIYALNTGVDVSADMLPSGMTYYQQVEEAIQSQDMAEKLNVLLLGQFRYFTNVTDVLQRTRNQIVACLLGILILGIAAWISRHLKRFFPLSFFAIGHQREVLARLEKKRELWIVGIIVGFVVNIIAGALVAIFGG